MKSSAFTSIRPTKIRFYLRCFEELFGEPKKLLTGTHLSIDKLDDPYLLVDIPSYIKVVSNMIHLAKTPELAFKLGEQLIPGDFGVLGHAFSACENERDGFRLWQKYNHLFFGNLINVSVNKSKSNDSLMWCDLTPQVNLQSHLMIFFMEEIIAIERQMFKKYSDSHKKDLFYHFAYPPPNYAHLYSELLQCEVLFDQQASSIGVLIDDEYYSPSYPRRDPETLRLCTNYLEEISNILNSRTTWTAKIRFLLSERLPSVPNIEELADHFNCSVSSLYRHLAMEDTTYKDILADLRKELAQNYLVTTTMTVDEISTALGFSDSNSLRRSFKQWTGKTMNEYKANYYQTIEG